MLLFLVENQRAVQFYRFYLAAPEHSALAHGQIAQLFQPVHRGSRGAGIVENILYRRAANAAQQFQDTSLHCRGLGPGSGKFHGFLGADRERGNLFGPVPGSPDILLLTADPLFLQKIGKHAGKRILIGNHLAQRLGIRRAAQRFQTSEHRFGSFFAQLLFFPAAVFGEREGAADPEPRSRREHDANRVVKSTEIPLP